MKELFFYDGPIQQLRLLGQEIMGYKCTLIQRLYKSIQDADVTNRHYEPSLAVLHIDSLLHYLNFYTIPSLHYVNR
jgi:hypothetical protein